MPDYGFNGQERSLELNNLYTALYWEYDSQIGIRWNLDPVKKENESPYLCFSADPLKLTDVLGNNGQDYVKRKDGKVVYDSRVVNETSAKAYYEGGTYLGPRASYTSVAGEKIVLGENGNYTKNGKAARLLDMATVNNASPYGFTSSDYVMRKTGDSYNGQFTAAGGEFNANDKWLGLNGDIGFGNFSHTNNTDGLGYDPLSRDLGFEVSAVKANLGVREGLEKLNQNGSATGSLFSANANLTYGVFLGEGKKYGILLDANAGAQAAKGEVTYGFTILGAKFTRTSGGSILAAHAGVTTGLYYDGGYW